MCERSAAVLVENEVRALGRVSDIAGASHTQLTAPLIPLLSPLQVHNNAHAGLWASRDTPDLTPRSSHILRCTTTRTPACGRRRPRTSSSAATCSTTACPKASWSRRWGPPPLSNPPPPPLPLSAHAQASRTLTASFLRPSPGGDHRDALGEPRVPQPWPRYASLARRAPRFTAPASHPSLFPATQASSSPPAAPPTSRTTTYTRTGVRWDASRLEHGARPRFSQPNPPATGPGIALCLHGTRQDAARTGRRSTARARAALRAPSTGRARVHRNLLHHGLEAGVLVSSSDAAGAPRRRYRPATAAAAATCPFPRPSVSRSLTLPSPPPQRRSRTTMSSPTSGRGWSCWRTPTRACAATASATAARMACGCTSKARWDASRTQGASHAHPHRAPPSPPHCRPRPPLRE